MGHQTFYRKYRSTTFSELIGQDHIVRILRNAVTQGQLAHAYLFSGPRGTGKTSAARILAKLLNCTQGEPGNPCGTCVMCQKIAQGQAVDVIEIDAASHNGVDHIRSLTEQVHFLPVEGHYKVYLIDEVHMLSTGAFNALLKTLEEPPANVVFILATTERHKVPPTVLSRCQHLNFRRLSVSDISAQLAMIAQKEGFTVSQEAQILIARQADGCMRDAVSLLEQVWAFEGGDVTAQGVARSLGGVEKAAVYQVAQAVFSQDPADMMRVLQAVLDSGLNASQLLLELIEVCRNSVLVLLKVVSPEEADPLHAEALKGITAGIALPVAQRALEAFCSAQADLRFFPNPGTLLQVTCLGVMGSSVATGKDMAVPSAVSKPIPSPPNTHSVVSEALPSQVGPLPTASLNPSFSESTPLSPKKPTAMVPPKETVVGSVASGLGTSAWGSVVQAVKESRHALFSILNQSEVVRVTDHAIEIRLKQDFRFFREKLAEASSQAFLGPLVEKAFGKPLRVHTGQDNPSASPSTTSQKQVEKPVVTSASVLTNVVSSDVPKVFAPVKDDRVKKINHIVAMFDGAVVEEA